MARYKYTAINSSDGKASGAVDADDISKAAARLRAGGLTITALSEDDASPKTAENGENDILSYFSIVRNSDIVLLFRQLASLIAGGVTIVSALTVLEKQGSRRRLRHMLARIRHEVESGKPLSEALERYPKTFPAMVISIVRTGEISGTMEESLDRIANQLEQSAMLRTQLTNGLMYPAIVAVATVAISAFLVGFVIPRIVPFLSVRGGRLPWNTQFLMDLSAFFKTNIKALSLYALGGLAVIALVYRTRGGRRLIDLARMRLPVVGFIFRIGAIVRFSRTISILLESGVPMLESLRAVRGVVNNAAMQQVVDNMIAKVMTGESLSASIVKASAVFTPMVASVVKVGEETGSMGGAMALTADIHQRILETRIKRLTSLIEPALTVILALIVSFVVWSLVAGIMSMYG